MAESASVTLFIDADATPRDCVATADRLAAAFGARVITVSSIYHSFDRPNHITVDPHAQAVDMEILRRLHDHAPAIVITQDYGLAALALGYQARVVSPLGLIFTDENIDRLLFERDLHARERRATGRNRGPRKRTAEDAVKFEQALQTLLKRETD